MFNYRNSQWGKPKSKIECLRILAITSYMTVHESYVSIFLQLFAKCKIIMLGKALQSQFIADGGNILPNE